MTLDKILNLEVLNCGKMFRECDIRDGNTTYLLNIIPQDKLFADEVRDLLHDQIGDMNPIISFSVCKTDEFVTVKLNIGEKHTKDNIRDLFFLMATDIGYSFQGISMLSD